MLRFCLKVMGQPENDMVLGTSCLPQRGARPPCSRSPTRGSATSKGVTDDTTTVKGVYIDGPDAETIAAKARAVRTAAGLLTGYAAGLDTEVDDTPTTTLLQDVLSAIGDNDKAWSLSIVDRLAELRPDAYGTWAELPSDTAKATQLSTALKPYGITTKQVWATDPTTGKGRNLTGVERADIAEAITERN